LSVAQAPSMETAFPAAAGETGALARAHDWASTSLGPIEAWPESLKTTVRTILLSPVPIVTLWGEDGVMIYNDAYSVFAGGRHPRLLGSKVREGWPEIAAFNDHVMKVGLAGGTLAFRDQELTLHRSGEPEQVWMNLDYSPVLDESGAPAGVIAIVVETTERVLAERRQAFLVALGDALRELSDPRAIMAGVARMLGEHLGAGRVGYGEVEGEGDEAHVAIEGDWRPDSVASIAGRYHLASYAAAFEADLQAGHPVVVEDFDADPRTAGLGAADAHAGLGIRAQVVVPLVKAGRLAALLFVHSPAPRRWSRNEVALVREVAERTWDAVERAWAVAALRESEDHYRYAVELDPQTTWTSAPDGQLDRVNRRWFEWTGTTGLGSTYAEGLHEDDRARTFEVWGRSVATGEPYDIEHRVKMRDGSYRWMHSRAFSRRDDRGRIVKWYGTTEDIHERYTAEAALRESEERFRTIADSVPVLIWMTDAQGKGSFANKHYEREFGVPPEAILRNGWRRIVHDEDAGPHYETVLDAFALREPFVSEVRVRDKAGRLRWLRCQGVPRFDASGAFLGHTGANIDITEAKLARNELERLVAERTGELAAANRQLMGQIEERERVEATLHQMQRLEAVGQLTSGVAHDFNNLLTVILGNVGFVENAIVKAGIDGRTRDRLGSMRSAAERGATLTAQLLAFSRSQRLEAKPLDLNGTAAGMRDLLQSSLGGAVRLEMVLRPGLWPALVDPTQIELVILNLAINARDAMEVGGSLTIETGNATLRAPSRPEEPPAGDYVMVSVSDTGTGMPPDVMAKAFEPFFTTKPVGKGSGLGLAQVYGFAKQSGGGVRIETRLGVGTTVKVFLPRAAEQRSREPDAAAAAADERLDGEPRRVLVVDDDSAVREVTAALLAEMGCLVVEAGSGGAALHVLERDRTPFDLMVVDFAMPGMNGAEVAREAALRWPELPVLFVTGYADLTALQEVGEDRVVQKPFRNGELGLKVRQLLGATGGGKVVPLRR